MADILVQKSNILGEFESPYVGSYSGDYTFAGMFLARAALDSSIICTNLNPSSEQSGKIVLDILKSFGAKVSRSAQSVNVKAEKLCGISVDLSEFVQIAPMIAFVAPFAKGKTCISGFDKAPDLLEIIAFNLNALGVRYEMGPNNLWVWPQAKLTDAVLNAKNNPYLALALILVSSFTKGKTYIRNIDGLLKRYPEFEDVFKSLGGQFEFCTLTF